jgi:hypothetical protein
VVARRLFAARPRWRFVFVKLIKAGYLQPALGNEPDAITTAIARLKENLRGRLDNEGPA